MQYSLFHNEFAIKHRPLKVQLLKWIGNKQRFAHEIISYFPSVYGRYYEPFLGSGAVLGTLSPENGNGSDTFLQLIEIWLKLKNDPEGLIDWYSENWRKLVNNDKVESYNEIRTSYNENPNPKDLLFLSRSCYGGVIRFRKNDGYISTPVGIHNPIKPESFRNRVFVWNERIKNSNFFTADFEEAMDRAKRGDLIYCDPPYKDSQTILYGAQKFSLRRLFKVIERCTRRGVNVALSIDGTKKSGNEVCDIEYGKDIFKREIMVNVGRSMLKRFQMNGKTLEKYEVRDRLLLNY